MKNVLFSPLQIKNLVLKNRICVPAMVCFNWADDSGQVSDRHIQHYRALAAGGPGLIIQEATCVSADGRMDHSQLGIWSDDHIAGLRRIADVVHAHNCPIIMQLHHAGITSATDFHGGPSDYAGEYRGTYYIGHGMSITEMESVRNDFTLAAKRALAAGYDGVELHGCHGYLLCQYFNKRVNRRSDEYGQDHARFALEILDAVRQVTPASFVVGMRLGGFEPTLKDAIRNAVWMQDAGIDYLNISYGFANEQEPYAPEDFAFRDIIYAAQEIKSQVHVPVFAVNGIKSPQMAEDILEQTRMDMVNIGRGFLVNHNWANDAREGIDTGECLECSGCLWTGHGTSCPGKALLERKRGQRRK